MSNQVPMEAVYSATYLEDYLDCVENFPSDIQPLISRMLELDVCYKAHIEKFESQLNLCNTLENCNSTKKTRAILRMQEALISAQVIADEKMSLVETIREKIEKKTELLEQDRKNLGFGKEEQSSDNKEQQQPANNVSSSVEAKNNERPPKRVRRTRHHNENNTSDRTLRSRSSNNSISITTQKKNTNGKKRKRNSS